MKFIHSSDLHHGLEKTIKDQRLKWSRQGVSKDALLFGSTTHSHGLSLTDVVFGLFSG